MPLRGGARSEQGWPDVPAVSYWASLSLAAEERSSVILERDSTWTAVLE